ALFCFHEANKYKLYRTGLLGVALWGDVTIDPVVAQGCRPIGKIMQVSECERNLILGLEGKPPLALLQDTVGDLSQSDRELAQHSLFIGVVMNEFKLNPSQGDFLIRNIIGVDPRSGAIAVGDRMRPGQRIQLHLRDGKASAEDLEEALINYMNQLNLKAPNVTPTAALMFSCMGRGERLYGKPNFDSELLQKHIGLIAFSGFFCSGEIGPVGGTTFLHGYTSVFGIVRPKS
ncbi:MAG: FIST C-terminal domain-containing protein, partial [Pseudanabaena sp.]